MLDGLLDLILQIIFYIATLVSSIITVPLLGLVSLIFPGIDEYLDVTMAFWNRILLGANFAKEVFLNLTGYPRALLYIILTYWFARLGIMVTKRAIKFILNMYAIIRGDLESVS